MSRGVLLFHLLTGILLTVWIGTSASSPFEWVCFAACALSDVGMAFLLVKVAR